MVNLVSLDGSGYARTEEPRMVGTITVHRYQLGSLLPDDARRAAAAIDMLLRDNAHLLPLFPRNPPEALEEQVTQNPHLVINGRAVCLASLPKADVEFTYVDSLFSEAPIDLPIQCERGHFLEEKFVRHWVPRAGDVCPGGDHRIGSTNFDPRLYLTTHADMQRASRRIQRDREGDANAQRQGEELNRQREILQIQRIRFEQVASCVRPDRSLKLGGTSIKAVVKLVPFIVQTSLKAGSNTIKEMLKKLPIISFFLWVSSW
ncbi:MAG: hypothetical protein LVR00_09870 [Rhabdochlamydiaceae bacterium]|jgi:hypothetical protein